MPPENREAPDLLSPAWAGRITAQTEQNSRDIRDLRRDFSTAMRTLSGRLWLVVLSALVGPSAALLLAHVFGG